MIRESLKDRVGNLLDKEVISYEAMECFLPISFVLMFVLAVMAICFSSNPPGNSIRSLNQEGELPLDDAEMICYQTYVYTGVPERVAIYDCKEMRMDHPETLLQSFSR